MPHVTSSPIDIVLWLTVASTFLGGLLHSLSTDGAASVLAHFGIKGRIPASILPITILVCTIVAGVIDHRLAGADWQHAAGAALLALMGGTFGAGVNHSLTSGKGGPPAAAGVLLLFAFVSLSACTPGQRGAARSVLDVAQVACLVAHQELPDSAVADACAVTEPFFGPMREVLASSRKASAKAVAAARANVGAVPCSSDR